MAKIENSTLLKVCQAICKAKSPEGPADSWDSEDSAIVVVRSILEEIGEKELLDNSDASRATRKDLVKMIAPLMTAAVNFRRQYLADKENGPLATKPKESADKIKEYC